MTEAEKTQRQARCGMNPRGLVRFQGMKRRRAPMSAQPIIPPTITATKMVDITTMNS